MNSEYINKIMEHLELDEKSAEEFSDFFWEWVAQYLTENKELHLEGIGTFTFQDKKLIIDDNEVEKGIHFEADETLISNVK